MASSASAVEQMHSTMKKYQVAFTETTVENKRLKQENAQLEQSLEKATHESTLKQFGRCQAAAGTMLTLLLYWIEFPKKFLMCMTRDSHGRKERPIEQSL